ncbi:hypothetical protein BPNPMPFG_006325 [Mesorhizobium sp. AR07]|uniref:hypothetical protein n=1 Tax=Mesorhizobium sp. AR07 TaxID=2865838 RepID=UPI00215E6274|nr:hypothetical protein [Mesorhizobium sp. AR07]UVK44407.1 hypothetical protein BPNPMPFG_006325 [Mesorhizobium sp. AR07]
MSTSVIGVAFDLDDGRYKNDRHGKRPAEKPKGLLLDAVHYSFDMTFLSRFMKSLPPTPATSRRPAAAEPAALIAAGVVVDKETVERLQQQLKDLGYTEVPGIDSKGLRF